MLWETARDYLCAVRVLRSVIHWPCNGWFPRCWPADLQPLRNYSENLASDTDFGAPIRQSSFWFIDVREEFFSFSGKFLFDFSPTCCFCVSIRLTFSSSWNCLSDVLTPPALLFGCLRYVFDQSWCSGNFRSLELL